jgi:hypothetical protein
MSSTADRNIEKILSADGKYHIILIYLVHDDGYCGGAYFTEYFKFVAGVGGESVDKMIDQAYKMLKGHMKDEDFNPLDIKNIKEWVQFDLVECHNDEEQVAALDLQNKGKSYEEINKAVSQ